MEWNEGRILARFRVILSTLVAILFLTNIVLNNKYIMVIGITADAILMLESFMCLIISEHNLKVAIKRFEGRE